MKATPIRTRLWQRALGVAYGAEQINQRPAKAIYRPCHCNVEMPALRVL
jgi:hypothetical protein